MNSVHEELVMLRDAARGWVGDNLPVTRFRAMRDAGQVHDGETWREIAAMGWTGILVPESHGGLGLGFAAIGAVLEELGANLALTPYLQTALAAVVAIDRLADEGQKARCFEPIVSGECIAALALDGRGFHPDRMPVARAGADGWKIDGSIEFVPAGMSADTFIIPALQKGGENAGAIVTFAVAADNIARAPAVLVDHGDYARLVLDGILVPETARMAVDTDEEGMRAIIDCINLGLAAEMIGTAQRAYDITVDYLKTREQFGRLIGSFQALQHRAATMLVDLELARATVEAALEAMDKGERDAASRACCAKAMASSALHLISSEGIQMHGGIGMTDEHDIGLYLKRARVSEQLFGSAGHMRARFAGLRGF